MAWPPGTTLPRGEAPRLIVVTARAPADTITALMQWSYSTGPEKGFTIERSADGGTFAKIGAVGKGALSYTDQTATTGHTYCYRYAAFNEGGAADPSPHTGVSSAIPPSGTASTVIITVVP